jgi:glycosyltransferase involved in cell wall biosynthesis
LLAFCRPFSAVGLAVVTGIDKPTTTRSKGGVEVWTANFALENARRGHTVDLYATAGSVEAPGVRLIPSLDRPVSEYFSEPYFTENPSQFDKRKEQFMGTVYASLLKHITDRQDDYDIIIDSVSYPTFSFNTGGFRKPVLAIGHFPIDFMLRFYVQTLGWPPQSMMVFPSRHQHDQATFLPQQSKCVIPHGVDTNTLAFHPEGGAEMLWIGRVHHQRMNKGLDDALVVARNLKRPLAATGVVERSSRAYFEDVIRPLLSGDATFLGQDNDTVLDKGTLFGKAKLLLLPLKWEEAFGLVMTEAMACGTPVIAYARGAAPEIIADGVSGFLVNPSADHKRGDYSVKPTGIEGLCEAVERIYAMRPSDYAAMRQACRARAESLFSLSSMMDRYEHLYAAVMRSSSQAEAA